MLWCSKWARGTGPRSWWLCRFDPVYVVYFKTNKQFIKDYPHMRGYVREMYALLKVRHLHSPSEALLRQNRPRRTFEFSS